MLDFRFGLKAKMTLKHMAGSCDIVITQVNYITRSYVTCYL